MANFLLVLFPALLLSYRSVISESSALRPQIDGKHKVSNDLVLELQEVKLKIAWLESVLDEWIGTLEAKSVYLDEREKQIEEMAHQIRDLQSDLSSFKGGPSYVEERVIALEEEVRQLWAASRNNNFELHSCKIKAQDAEPKVEEVTSRVEKISDIVTEQWIQIQQLEQALKVIEMRSLGTRRQVRCSFLKFIGNFYGNHVQKVIQILEPCLFGKESTLASYLSRALYNMKGNFATAKKYHHQLQGHIKQKMETYELTAALANEELIFFMASAVIVFPVMVAWMWLSTIELAS